MTTLPRILAIDPGTREMGVAVFDGPGLVYHGVKVIRKGRTPHSTLKNAIRAAERLISDFRPSILVVEKTFIARNRNAALLNVLGDEIQAMGKRKRLTLVALAPSTVRKTVCGFGNATKEEVGKVMTAVFPELKAFLAQNRKWKDRFHANMFDAVALGLAYLIRGRAAGGKSANL